MNSNPGDKLTKKPLPRQLLWQNSGSRDPDLGICEEVPTLSVTVTESVSRVPWHWADGGAAQDVTASATQNNEMKTWCY